MDFIVRDGVLVYENDIGRLLLITLRLYGILLLW